MSPDPLVIVSADCHIGPRLVEDLRPCCPRRLRDAFDEYVAATDRSEGRYVCRERRRRRRALADPQPGHDRSPRPRGPPARPGLRRCRRRGPGTDDFTGEESIGKLALRFTFAGLPEDHVRTMLGLTAAKVYGLDADELTAVARAIHAPTHADVSVPLAKPPIGASTLAFRTYGPWA